MNKTASAVAALLLAFSSDAAAARVRMFDAAGILIHECERTGDVTVTPDGAADIPCGPNLLAAGVIGFSKAATEFNYGSVGQLPFVRAGGANGPLSAELKVTSGPCVLSTPAVIYGDGAASPQTVPSVSALPGVTSGACTVEIAGRPPLAVAVVDPACRP
jgi:hypothetical protein